MPQPNQQSQPPAQITRNGLPLVSRLLSVDSGTIDVEQRTVELVWSTGAAVRRFDWNNWRYYNESLSMLPEHCRLNRLNGGAPMLNTHQQWDLKDQIGVVEKAWLDNGEGRALLRFSKRDDVEPIWQDVVDKIVRNVSVGYIVHTYQITERDGQTPEYLAVDWEPTEISLVPVPADADAGIRSAMRPDDAPNYPVRYLQANQDDHHVDPIQPQEPETRTQEPTMTPEEIEALRQQERTAAMQAENQRQKDIRNLVGLYPQLGTDFARTLMDDPACDIHRARELVLERLAQNSDANQERSAANVETLQDETEVRRSAMQAAIHHRAFGGDLPEAARQYRGMNLTDMARACAEAAGANVRGLARSEIVELALNNTRGYGMHTTSDFPVILANEANRSMLQGYELAGQTFRPLVREVSAPDFKDVVKLRVGNQVELKEVTEAGEFEIGNLNDAESERYKLRTFGRIVNISRQVIINDDLGVFTDTAFGFGRSAANLESNLVWGLIINNQKLGDGKALFHAGHGNIAAAAAAVGIDAIDALDQLIGAQTEPGTGDDLNLYGKYILVPRTLRLAAQRAIGFVSATEVDKLNPLAGQYQVIAEPRLTRNSAARWYLAAGPESAPTIELAYLEGQRGVYTTSREGFEVDGVQVKGRIDVGVGLMDYRWITTNPGQ
ncbi:peptidase U35 phage prohead HK97 [Pseudogulbenkiania sp. NH8B]|uniref:prohead protease/major capsid protein fusion protein n=1 Tax=Pseudogulbenkiania sp. (strain NH8B) TaxID=748280 RepID=UPI0002279A92|nr:prohead protease/major capsid protein fusion protein [Pseudogulbenkiania sp. NH8B]BAK75812.1 peptidase U35 phage prohead HK97 [Pseudogulbenkiania sp. NH8B]